jgi:hypothetical protein
MKSAPKCYYCDQAIKFDHNTRSTNGKFIPLNNDGSKQDCSKSPYKLHQRLSSKKLRILKICLQSWLVFTKKLA